MKCIGQCSAHSRCSIEVVTWNLCKAGSPQRGAVCCFRISLKNSADFKGRAKGLHHASLCKTSLKILTYILLSHKFHTQGTYSPSHGFPAVKWYTTISYQTNSRSCYLMLLSVHNCLCEVICGSHEEQPGCNAGQ